MSGPRSRRHARRSEECDRAWRRPRAVHRVPPQRAVRRRRSMHMAVDKQLSPRDVMRDAPVIPVIVLADADHAVPLARALVAGGIRMLEVTLRTPVALQCIEAIAREVPDAVAGAGTVRNAADAQAAVKAGARFIVSPGYTSALGRAIRELGAAYLPGVATGSEVMAAQDDGYSEMKSFPAVPAGGVPMLKG